MKEGREVVLVLACHPSNTTLYTLSLFHSNGWLKLKLEEEQQQQLQTKKQNYTTCSNSGSAQTEDPRGVFIGTRGKGATWEACGPKRRRARPVLGSTSPSLLSDSWMSWIRDLIPWADKIFNLKSMATW